MPPRLLLSRYSIPRLLDTTSKIKVSTSSAGSNHTRFSAGTGVTSGDFRGLSVKALTWRSVRLPSVVGELPRDCGDLGLSGG